MHGRTDEWMVAGGCPTTMLMNVERRIGHDKPVIKKALTELGGEVCESAS